MYYIFEIKTTLIRRSKIGTFKFPKHLPCTYVQCPGPVSFSIDKSHRNGNFGKQSKYDKIAQLFVETLSAFSRDR